MFANVLRRNLLADSFERAVSMLLLVAHVVPAAVLGLAVLAG